MAVVNETHSYKMTSAEVGTEQCGILENLLPGDIILADVVSQWKTQ